MAETGRSRRQKRGPAKRAGTAVVAAVVCSIGNVPLAVVLWKGGISFGGVVRPR